MRRSNIALMTCVSLLTVPTTVWSKGQTIKIIIEGDALSAPVEITNPAILGQFNIWNGPGVSTSGPDGVPHLPAYLDPDKSAGRFIDWPRGIATDRPSKLQRLEVTFYVGVPREPKASRKYIFTYEVDASALQGYIYLPRWMNNLIAHGIEGKWLYSSARWNEIIAPIVAKQTIDLPPTSVRGNLNCIAGHGSFGEDGTIEFMRFNDDGIKISHWRYETSTEGYESVRKHIGDVEPGDDIEVSCWPPRS